MRRLGGNEGSDGIAILSAAVAEVAVQNDVWSGKHRAPRRLDGRGREGASELSLNGWAAEGARSMDWTPAMGRSARSPSKAQIGYGRTPHTTAARCCRAAPAAVTCVRPVGAGRGVGAADT